MKNIKEFFQQPKTKIFLIIFFVLIFFLLAFYPGIMTYDSNIQWGEVLTGNITNSHPFISTFFIYLLSFIYKSPVTIIVFQMIISSLTFTKLYFMSDIKNNWLKTLVYILIISFPLISVFSITLWKDILYSYYLLNVGIITYEWALEDYKSQYNKKYLLILLLTLVFSYRVNGMVSSVLFLLIIICALINKKEGFKNIVILPIIFILIISCFTLVKNYYLSKLPEDNEVSISTIDHYMIWITGEYLNNGVVLEEEYKFLNNINDVSVWKNKYNPYLINPTNEMNIDENFVINNEKEFRNIFLNMTKRNLVLFIGHYLKADSLFISPKTTGYVYTYGFSNFGNILSFADVTNPIIPKVHVLFEIIITVTIRSSVLKYIYAPANPFYISIIMIIYLVVKTKQKVYYWLSVPMVTNTISMLPVNIAQDLRYAYINYLSFILVAIIFINYFINKKEVKK